MCLFLKQSAEDAGAPNVEGEVMLPPFARFEPAGSPELWPATTNNLASPDRVAAVARAWQMPRQAARQALREAVAIVRHLRIGGVCCMSGHKEVFPELGQDFCCVPTGPAKTGSKRWARHLKLTCPTCKVTSCLNCDEGRWVHKEVQLCAPNRVPPKSVRFVVVGEVNAAWDAPEGSPALSPAAAAPAQPPKKAAEQTARPVPRKELLHREVQKHFPEHGTFRGTVISIKFPHYRVRYEDGDQEDMTRAELEEWLLPPAEKTPAAPAAAAPAAAALPVPSAAAAASGKGEVRKRKRSSTEAPVTASGKSEARKKKRSSTEAAVTASGKSEARKRKRS